MSAPTRIHIQPGREREVVQVETRCCHAQSRVRGLVIICSPITDLSLSRKRPREVWMMLSCNCVSGWFRLNRPVPSARTGSSWLVGGRMREKEQPWPVWCSSDWAVGTSEVSLILTADVNVAQVLWRHSNRHYGQECVCVCVYLCRQVTVYRDLDGCSSGAITRGNQIHKWGGEELWVMGSLTTTRVAKGQWISGDFL